MPSYVIYARKSTESEDHQVRSIESQVQEMKTLALRHGVTVEDVLTEARSAKAPGRPVFTDLMRRVRRGQVSGVLCWKMDRLARNPYDAGLILQAQLDGKLERIITSDGVKTADGNDRLLGSFEFALATKYIDDLRANVTRGNRARFLRGWPNFRPPAGYIEDHLKKVVLKDPDRFDLIRRAWDLLLTGTIRPSKILLVLNKEWGYRSRHHNGPMSLSGLYGVFANEFYMGIMRLAKGETYRGAYEPMVTPEEFARAQEILGRKGRPRSIHHDFTFAGLLHCASCGRALVAEEHVKPSGKKYVYYRCHRRASDEACAEPALPEKVLREQLVEDLRRMRISPEAAEWLRDNLANSLAAELTQLRTARESLQKSLEQATTEEEALLTLRLRGSIDDETFERRRAMLQDQKAQLQIRLERPSQTPEALLARLDSALAFSAKASEIFDSGTRVQQRQILESVGSNYRAKGKKVLYDAKKPFSLASGKTASSQWWTKLEDVRTWLLHDSEDFTLPDLSGLSNDDTMSWTEDSIKVGLIKP